LHCTHRGLHAQLKHFDELTHEPAHCVIRGVEWADPLLYLQKIRAEAQLCGQWQPAHLSRRDEHARLLAPCTWH